MTKIIIAMMIAAVVFSMINGISILKRNFYWRSSFFIMQWDYLKTEMAFINYNYGGIINWLAARKNSAAKSANFEKAKSIPILLYHGVITDPGWKPDDVNILLGDFREQLFALKKAGYQTVKLEDYLAFSQGKKDLPEKSFLLTFDDGRKDSFYPVDPILKTLGYSAVMNVITSRSLGKGNEQSTFHLSRLELQKMLESGRWQIESHGRDDHDYQKISADGKDGHFLSNKLWLNDAGRLETDEEYKKRIRDDLLGSKTDIEKNLGVKVLAFAYPFGDFGQASDNFPQSRDIVINFAQSIYPLSFVQTGSSDFPTNYAEKSFLAKRIGVSSQISAEALLTMLENTQNKAENYEDNFRENKGWLKGWGTLTIKDGAMTISDSQLEDSGLSFLSGSYLWKDYSASAKIKILNVKSFALTARYQDENNYVSCDFSDDHIALTQRVGRVDLPDVETVRNSDFSSGRVSDAAIKVSGNKAGCYLDGNLMVEGTVDENLDHGGISFKVWDTGQKGATMMVTDLKVTGAPPV